MKVWQKIVANWRDRQKQGNHHQLLRIAEFLPAALEIQESPPNPIARKLAMTLALLASLALVWAFWGTVEVVSTAEGKIIPGSRTKQIQALQKAIVNKILVTEGQQVRRGQALLELDSTLTLSDQNRIVKKLEAERAALWVAKAFLRYLGHVDVADGSLPIEHIDADGSMHIAENSPVYQRLLNQQIKQHEAQLAGLQSTLAKNTAEALAAQAQIQKYEQILPIVTKRSTTLSNLLERGFISEVEYLAVEQERIQCAQDLISERQRLLQLSALREEIQQNTLTLTAQTAANHLAQIAEIQNRIASYQEEFIQAKDINARQVIYAPVNGRVQELTIHTLGGVVTDAQQLMLIVPDNEPLEVEAFLANQDIGFVREGMTAQIKIHTFPFTRYGMISGEVTSISNDASLSEQLGLIYSMRIKMAQDAISVNNKSVKLLPGMAVTVEIPTDQRRVVDYFIRPTKRYLAESLRER